MTLRRKLTIALSVVSIGWLIVLVAWGPAPFAASFDDAYYYFTIGRNWANGHASTFDGLDRTNGYHPLWQLLTTLVYLVGFDGFAAVRALLVLQLAMWVAAMLAVIGVVSDAIGGWPRLVDRKRDRSFCDAMVVAVFVVITANPFVFKMTVNGLESGLVVPVGALLIANAVRFRGCLVTRATTAQRILTGVLLAFAFLSRTDAIILIGLVALWSLLDHERGTSDWGLRIRRTAQVLIIPAVVIIVYLVVNAMAFGTPMQISGMVKRLPLTLTRALIASVFAAIGCAILIAAKRPIRATSRLLRTRRLIRATAFYPAFCVGLLGYYSTLQEVPYLWYFAPLALQGTLFALLAIADLAEGAILEAAGQAHGQVQLGSRAPALILLVPLTAALIWSIPSYVDPGARSLMVHDAAAGQWIDGKLPPDARVASWDAGVIGYFAHRHVVNLDGVVNSHDYFVAMRTGGVPEFLAERDVRWVANHGGDVNGRDPDIDRQIRTYFGSTAARRIDVVFRTTYRYTGSLDGSRTNTSTKQMGTYVYRLTPGAGADGN